MAKYLWVVILLVGASVAAAQPLSHGIPDLCAADPACTVVPANATQTLTGTHSTIKVLGTATIAGQLRALTIVCYPGSSLTFADGSETIIRNATINTAADPEQWGHGIVGDCRVRARGRMPTPFVRLGQEALAGHSGLVLASAPTDWRVGDRLVIPDTRQLSEPDWFNSRLALQHEVCEIAAISVILVECRSPLTFNHRGARDADGTIRVLPHVGNLTRSITIRSESPSGTRGHVAFVGRADVDIRGVQFVNLGRTNIAPLQSLQGSTIGTNQIGRYPVHFHHVMGPSNPDNTGYQYVFEGNVIEAGLKWPVALHNTHYGLVKDNVIYGAGNLTGAGIALEDGPETDNLIESNFLVDIRGDRNPRETLPASANGTTPGSGGDCIWGAGFNNRFVNNVLAGCRNSFQQVVSGTGFKLAPNAAPLTLRNPRFRGADTTDPAQSTSVTVQHQPILEMRGNEVYGLAASGMTVWHLGTDGNTISSSTMGESIVKDFTVWHTYAGIAGGGVFWGYPSNRLTFDGLLYRINGFDPFGGPGAFTAGDYRTIDFTVRNADIHAGYVIKGLTDPVGTLRLQNIRATTRDPAFQFSTPSTPGTGARNTSQGKWPVQVEIFSPQIAPWPGQPLRTIAVQQASSTAPPNDPLSPFTVVVANYQNAGAAFQVYFPIQATTGQYYGGQAPCSDNTSRPEVTGITCATDKILVPPPQGPQPPPQGPQPPPETPQPPCSASKGSRRVPVLIGFGTLIWVTLPDPASGCSAVR